MKILNFDKFPGHRTKHRDISSNAADHHRTLLLEMLEQSRSSVIDVNIVGNPSLKVQKAFVTLNNEFLVDYHKLANDVASVCNGQPHRIYWRFTELRYSIVSGYIALKAALNTMRQPFCLYVVVDEPRFMFTEFSEDSVNHKNDKGAPTNGAGINDNEEETCDKDFNEYDVSSLLRDREDSSDCVMLSDTEILRCAFDRRELDEPRTSYEFLTSKTSATFTKAKESANKQFEVLMKGFPQAKPVDTPSAETKKINSAGPSSGGGSNKKNDGFKTGNDVRDSGGQEPKRSEGRLDEITNTWKDVKRALSLLCVKTFSSNPAMLEAPPGSREDLVEAARTPCTPTDLDTMLYGYTNSIYVLDHTPESLPDMDMLQLFASPAGRALVTGDNRSTTTSTTRGGSTSSTSLSRESSLRGKKSRRASSTVSLPTPPPRQRKSSAELYKEAVEILGLTCSLTDSCRCLDCQSNYFDCDDDCGDARTELAAGTPILLDHALTHPLTCSIQ